MTVPLLHALGGQFVRKGRAPLAAPFVLGVTKPVAGGNVGVDPAVTLTPYSGAGAGGTLTISAPATYSGVDFGTTRVVVNSSDVTFSNCRWTFTGTATVGNGDGALIDFRGGTDYVNRRMYRCEVRNTSQWAPALTGVMGYGFALDRCHLHKLSDAIGTYVPSSRPDTALDVQILGCWLGEVPFFYAPTSGVVHPSDTKTHNDVIQHQGGRGLRVEGCVVDARYSTTVGTGTPASGNDTGGVGAASAPYTQAEGVAHRYAVVEGSGTYSPGQPGALLGGSIAGILFNDTRGGVADCLILNNWGSGGAFWLNAGGTTTSPFGEVAGNRIDNNQRAAGWGIGIKTGVEANVHDNVWTDGSGTVPRRNA